MTRRRRGRNRLPALATVAAFVLLTMIGCGEESASQGGTAESRGREEAPPLRVYDQSETARAGEELFNANCAACHGTGATGTSQGPTFISRIYHPGHHADFSIVNAVRNGVPQHHWSFGDMAPVTGLSEDDVRRIICYVREVQRANGLFDGDDYLTAC